MPVAKTLPLLRGFAALALLAALGTVTAPVRADAGAATVRLLQAPAWRERGGTREALRYGMALASGDRIVTGEGARVLIRLAEGSLVKLGADAEFALEKLSAPADPGGLFEGVLDVVRGAFRFTTTLADRRRDVRARVRSATIGIRGTDVWGKSEPERDFVVLLEGVISIERDGTQTTLDVPLSLFMAPRGEAALPVGPVDPDDLGRWAQETEPQAGDGVRESGGSYRLNLASYRRQAGAQALASRLDQAGHAVTTQHAEVDGASWWRVFGDGYLTREDAARAAARLAADFGLASPWISRSP